MTATLLASEYINKTLPGAVTSAVRAGNQDVIVINAAKLKDVVRILKDELGYDMLIDVAAVDWLKWKQPKPHRYELDYFFYATKLNARLKLTVPVPDEVHPEVDSIVEIFPIANWSERECWDMMGIQFRGHPNLKRLLMWEEFMGHPLRKDYPVDKRQPLPVMKDLL